MMLPKEHIIGICPRNLSKDHIQESIQMENIPFLNYLEIKWWPSSQAPWATFLYLYSLHLLDTLASKLVPGLNHSSELEIKINQDLHMMYIFFLFI